MAHQDLRPEDITIVIDSREQLPYTLAPLKTVRGSLPTGDYAVLGLESQIAVERKELSDYLNCVGQERDRFEREIQRLLAYETAAIFIEASWADLEAGGWRSKVAPAAAMSSLLGWMSRGIPIVLTGTREASDKAMAKFLFLAARHRFRELQSMLPGLKIAT